MIDRKLKASIKESLRSFPAVGIIGARQVGKTTLAKMLADESSQNTVYLDLELPSDLAKLEEAELYLKQYTNSLVIIDEIQRRKDLFPVLRALVDSDRKPGRFLILGSASPVLIKQSSESLASRIYYHELSPFCFDEIGPSKDNNNKLWSRGGYPESFLAASEQISSQWREMFIQTHLERDIPNLGIRVPASTLRRFWQMLAHCHGQLWNAIKIGNSLGIDPKTTRRYLDILQDTFMVRQLQPYHSNTKKRLVKSPKIYLRDSGLLHCLLRIHSYDDLLGHPVAGPS